MSTTTISVTMTSETSENRPTVTRGSGGLPSTQPGGSSGMLSTEPGGSSGVPPSSGFSRQVEGRPPDSGSLVDTPSGFDARNRFCSIFNFCVSLKLLGPSIILLMSPV